jgi:hypothetical protein
VVGQLYGKVHLGENLTFTAGRYLYDTPYLGPFDTRMTLNTFYGYSLIGTLGDNTKGEPSFRYGAGYIATIKLRDSNIFQSMSRSAGANADNGVGVAGLLMNWGPVYLQPRLLGREPELPDAESVERQSRLHRRDPEFPACRRAGLGAGASYVFTPIGLPGIAASVFFYQGRSDAAAGPLTVENEWDFEVDWRPEFKPFSSLWLRLRYGTSTVNQGNKLTTTDEIRLILNYSVKLY